MAEPKARFAAIVTGASRGIGRAIAVALGKSGYNITVNYRSDRAAADESARLVEQTGAKVVVIQADMRDDSCRKDLANQTIDALGPIAVLVNNAGISVAKRVDLLQVNLESYRCVLETNLEGPFFLAQTVAQHMITERHTYPDDVTPMIINLGSVSAYAASVTRAEYCLAKAGMEMMTKLFAVRLAEHGVLVYEIRPGIIATDMTAPAKEKYDKLIFQDGMLPIRRWGQPEDVGKAISAIVGGALPYSTGTVLDVDGGFHLRRL